MASNIKDEFEVGIVKSFFGEIINRIFTVKKRTGQGADHEYRWIITPTIYSLTPATAIFKRNSDWSSADRKTGPNYKSGADY